MKICRYCQVAQPEGNFEVARVIGKKVYRRLKCHKCKSQTQLTRKVKLKEWFDQYKQTLRCERCGFDDYRALEFHHAETLSKEFNVADMVQKGFPIGSITREIGKCHILCANCHRIEHYKE